MSAATEEEEAGAPRTPRGPCAAPTLRPLRPEVSMLTPQVEEHLPQVPLGTQPTALWLCLPPRRCLVQGEGGSQAPSPGSRVHLDGDLGRPGLRLGSGPTLGHLLPARLQSQADTMGRPHVRFLGEETHSLWTERSGQDIYNGLKKKKKKPGLQPPLSPSTSEMSCNTPSSLNIQTQNKCANSISPGNLGPMAAG